MCGRGSRASDYQAELTTAGFLENEIQPTRVFSAQYARAFLDDQHQGSSFSARVFTSVPSGALPADGGNRAS